MPTYEYRCDKCGKIFELFQKITDDPAQICPECGGKVQRLVSASNFVLKGKGWYKTDYAPTPVPPKCEGAGKEGSGPGPACKSCPANTQNKS
ncbi:MAG: zinc ribbon domain-containing protein [Proteobacteria bacterium]|nr:zinc ribbon domain-containing protein [Pseudomonadota bacterium]